jgi:8-oxo-dGTP pyrophosphatase MutT (NUDIX family)
MNKQDNDMISLSPDGSIIFAAGGLLWRETPDGREVLLVFRARYNDWSLPKGKFKPADGDLIATALREVKEETGYDVDVSGFAGCTCYEQAGRPKVVLFWHMAPQGAAAFEPSEEVEKCAWFPVREAVEQLDHENERDLLRRVGNADSP